MSNDSINETVFQIGAEDAGTRADAFLASQLKVSRSRAQKILESSLVAGKVAKPSYTLREGDKVVVPNAEIAPPAPDAEAPVEVAAASLETLQFIYEDDDLIVLNKPRGLTVHAGAGETGATLVDYLRALNKPLSAVGPAERAGIVHRLDKDTSGVMLVAKTDAAHWKIAADFEARHIKKRYFALCCGMPTPRGRIEAPIGRHPSNRKKMAILPDGRWSVTEYEVTKQWERFAALDVNLLTGRTHQIRVHLNYVNHPIVGDAVYGGFYRSLETAPTAEVRAAIEALGGQSLHAQKLSFNHPITGQELEFEAALPHEIERIVNALNAAQ